MKYKFRNALKARLAGLFMLVLAIAGCATVPSSLEPTVQAQPKVELTEVPFFPQQDFYCGPSTLAMVLNNLGEQTKPESIAELVYLPGRQGSLQLEMLAAPRRMGYLAYQLEPNLKALFAALNAGHPSVVLLNLSLPVAPQWHYAVVVGFDPQSNSMILRSGQQQRETIALPTFLKLWERSSNWAFVVLRPQDAPPAFATAQGYLNAAVALERSSLAKAAQAYQQGSKTWPAEPWFYFGQGNVAYQNAQYAEAEGHYRKAVGVYPDLADGWNNLAETLLKLDKKAEARAAINKAIALGGPRAAAYQATANTIQGH